MAEHAAAPHKTHSAVPYLLVWLALLGLTVATYLTGKQHLGEWALPLAMAIATTKSTLVVLFFMHLWQDKGASRLVLILALIFVGLLLTLTLTDMATRFRLATPAGAPFGTENTTPTEGLQEHEAPAE